MKFKILCLLCFLAASHSADIGFAAVPNTMRNSNSTPIYPPIPPAPSLDTAATASMPNVNNMGPMALLEWNPADLSYNRYRIMGEYIVVDGFSFGSFAEYEKQKYTNWRIGTAAAGLSAIQYLESQVLRGPYIKGELGTSISQIYRDDTAKNAMLYGAVLGLDLGYRFSLSQRICGAAAYGVRRVIPGFFDTRATATRQFFESNANLWSIRMQLSIGIAL